VSSPSSAPQVCVHARAGVGCAQLLTERGSRSGGADPAARAAAAAARAVITCDHSLVEGQLAQRWAPSVTTRAIKRTEPTKPHVIVRSRLRSKGAARETAVP
jgi:hypothetical protein